MSTDPLFMRNSSGEYFWYHNDHLWTPQIITTSSGALVWRAKYTSFGKVAVDPNSTVDNPLRFPGQYEDYETGLHYNWYRYFDPAIGRYIRSDPIGFSGGINFFTYVSNLPITKTDILGLAGETTHGLRKCLPGDDCATLVDKMNKLINSMEERVKEMEPFSETGQCHETYTGHAIQIKQQHIMFQNCQNYFINHKPPCNGPCPNYDPFPLPQWKPEPYNKYETPPNNPPIIPPILFPPMIGPSGGSGSGGGCFEAGTLVHTIKGLVPIEKLEIGDKVLAKNEKTGRQDYKRVVATVIAVRRDLVKIYIDSNVNKPLVASSNHKFYVKDKGWVCASMLSSKDILMDKQNNLVKIRNLESVMLDQEVKVYNIEVEDYHTYFVGEAGILNHNPFPLKNPGPVWRRNY